MSSVTFTFAATESTVIILKPFALIFATSGLRSGTEKPMWLTVVPIEPPVGACIRTEKDQKVRELDDLLLPVTGTDPGHAAAERVGIELLLCVHVRGVQMVVPVHDRTFCGNQNLSTGSGRHEQHDG